VCVQVSQDSHLGRSQSNGHIKQQTAQNHRTQERPERPTNPHGSKHSGQSGAVGHSRDHRFTLCCGVRSLTVPLLCWIGRFLSFAELRRGLPCTSKALRVAAEHSAALNGSLTVRPWMWQAALGAVRTKRIVRLTLDCTPGYRQPQLVLPANGFAEIQSIPGLALSSLRLTSTRDGPPRWAALSNHTLPAHRELSALFAAQTGSLRTLHIDAPVDSLYDLVTRSVPQPGSAIVRPVRQPCSLLTPGPSWLATASATT